LFLQAICIGRLGNGRAKKEWHDGSFLKILKKLFFKKVSLAAGGSLALSAGQLSQHPALAAQIVIFAKGDGRIPGVQGFQRLQAQPLDIAVPV
jgi:hypothetical protein